MLIGGKDGWQKENTNRRRQRGLSRAARDTRQAFRLRSGRGSNGPRSRDQECATHPDLILMDLGLPGITGGEARARLKANPSTRNIPVVINTAFNVGAYTNRALDAGAVEILHKPLELSTLQDVMHRYAPTEHGTTGVVVELKTQRLCQSPILQ